MPIQPQQTKHPRRKKVLLVFGLLALLFVAYLGSSVYSYYEQIQSGTVDYSAFQDLLLQESISQVAEGEVAVNPNLLRVNNFSDDPSYGPSDAKLTIVMFEDFECPFCGQLFQTMKKMRERYGSQVRFVYRDFPLLNIHPYAQSAAEAAQCAHDQGLFWEYHDLLYTNQTNLDLVSLQTYASAVGLDTVAFDNCLSSGKNKSEVLADYQDGLTAGVTGTPTLFFNGQRLPGVLTASGAEQLIQYYLTEDASILGQ